MKSLRLFEAYMNITSRNGTIFQVIWRFGSIPARTSNLDFGLLNDTHVYKLHNIFVFLSFSILIDWLAAFRLELLQAILFITV